MTYLIHLSVYMFVALRIHISVYMFAALRIHISVYLFIISTYLYLFIDSALSSFMDYIIPFASR